MKKTALLCLLSFILCLGSCRNIKEVQFTGVKGFKVGSIGAAGMNADILLGLKNPNNYGFTIYRSEFDVTYSGIYLGKAKLINNVHIGANAEETYSFALKSDFKNMNLAEILSLMNGASRKNLLEIKGDLKVGKLLLRKKFPIDVKEKIPVN